ncbi:MAG: signal recognition particle protein [Anaerolineales bacterium]|jgi:signal recognition particle subunit SRP54
MFETLTERLQGVFRNLARRGKLRVEDIDAALREIRLALLEADVHYQVVKGLLGNVRERALGQEVSRALNPSQQVIRILHQELVAALGEPARLALKGPTPRSVMLVGLQGSGKTTTAAKLAHWLRGQGERVWLVAADRHRPAAFEQLQILGEEIDVPVFHDPDLAPADLAEAALHASAKAGARVVILDTAGRSQLDRPMMDELQAIRQRIQPAEILLVADAMTGQEAVNISGGFHQALGLTGLILTKMDGDARGGAAISMRAVSGVLIKYIGTGEALDALEGFDPGRLASRILGMGDVIGLIEKAEAAMDADAAQEQAARLQRGELTLDDFAKQLEQLQRMGPLAKVLELLPGKMGALAPQLDGQLAQRHVVRTQAILRSMTPQERRRPAVLNASRKRRIAAGSGTSVQEVNQLLRQYQQMRKLLKTLKKRGLPGLGLMGR